MGKPILCDNNDNCGELNKCYDCGVLTFIKKNASGRFNCPECEAVMAHMLRDSSPCGALYDVYCNGCGLDMIITNPDEKITFRFSIKK